MSAKRAGSPGGVKLTDAEYIALGELRHSMRRFLWFSEAGAQEHGITSQQHQALPAIRADPALVFVSAC